MNLPFIFFLILLSFHLVSAAVPPTDFNLDYRPVVPSAKAPPQSELPMRHAWTFHHAPSFCKPLISRPKPSLPLCVRNPSTMRCKDNSYQLFSQMHQDYYIFTRHFSKLKRRGIYLDVAANEPIGLSNTFFMDTCLGWSGLCVEAQPHLAAKLYRQRSCAVLPTCVSDRDGAKVHFALRGGLSGIASTNKNKDMMKNEKVPMMDMTCTTMEFALHKHAVKRVDYLSLDVEGHEMHVLRGFNWNDVIINVMTIETQPDTIDEVENFLKGKGYVRHVPLLDERSKKSGRLWEDVIFLHNTVTFGKPE